MRDGELSPSTAIPQQALLAAIVASSHDAIISKTLDGVILSWNASARRIFGYDEAEAVGQPIAMLLPPERIDEEAGILQRLRRGEAVQDFETVRLHKNGRRIDVSVTSSPVRDANGVIVGASKIVRDMSAGKADAQALAQSRARLAGIVDSAMDAIITVDDRGTIVVFNDAAATMFGCRPEAARGKALERFIPARFRDRHAASMQRFAASGSTRRAMGFPGEIWALRSDGSEFPVEASISHVQVDGHALYTVIMRDVSELKQAQQARRALESQLREAQKMDAIGALAGGIAHDFNNIVASILGNVGLARLDLPGGHPARPYLDQIDQAASRARSVVRQILSFSRHQPQLLVNQPLRPIIDEALTLLRATLPTIVRLDTRLADDDIHVLADTTQIHQVLLNLCTNAWQALRGSTGHIEIGMAAVTLDAAAALRAGELTPGRYAHLWVRDNGIGMDDVTRSRIFEPFFTTKPRGEGTGLGLSVVHGIVVEHRGAITLDSAPGAGSTFHVYLPGQAPKATPATPSAGIAGEVRGQGKRVVYIDDDEVMVMMVERLLTRTGFAVVCHQKAREALDALRRDPRSCDIVVTDYNMPECTGLEVAAEMARIAPGVPVVISSGYMSEELLAGARGGPVRQLLEKENTFEELPGLITRLLAPEPTG